MTQQQKRGLVWDLPIRLFHWLLVVGITYCWASIELFENLQHHFWSGYFVFFLLIFRFIWGFVGTKYALFANLIKQIIKLVISKKKESSHPVDDLGHSSQGSLSVLVLLALVTTQVGTGLFNTDDYTFAPLSGLVSDETRILLGEIHILSFDALRIMICLHIFAILYYRIVRKKKLTQSMISGYKHAMNAEGFIRNSKLLVALLIVVASVVIVYATVNCCSDSIPVGEFDF